MDANFKRERLNSLTKEQLIKIILSGRNMPSFPNVNVQSLNSHPPEVLITMIMNAPGAVIDNNMVTDLKHRAAGEVFDRLYTALKNDPRYYPDMWTAKPHQIEHIERIVRGLQHPTNESRSFLDMSDMGLGKTVTTILACIRLKVRHLLIICPKRVISKWDKALKPLGLFDYRICTYSGIIGANGRGAVRWARYTDPEQGDKLQDMKWLQIRKTGKTGAGQANEFDWSFLPDNDQYGLGGTVVIWDEAQSVKNSKKKSQSFVCFREFITYLHTQQTKYIRCIMLSGTVMEKTDDLPYVLYALGYTKEASTSDKNAFVQTRLGGDFQLTMGPDWVPELAQVEGDRKLLLFLRGPGVRQGRVSFMKGAESNFSNPITFQGLQVRDEDIAQFMRINQDIQHFLMLASMDARQTQYAMGAIQKLLTEMEILKLVPIIEVARKALFTTLPNGAQSSVCFAMTRTASARYLAWRMEAILHVHLLQVQGTTEADLRAKQQQFINAIMNEYRSYNSYKVALINARRALPIKNGFMQYTEEQLRGMTMEDLITEYNRWVYYLDPDKFQFVCIFVGNMGNPKPTGFDLESPDEKNWVKESAALKSEQLDDMVSLYQNNRRRVFIANIQIARTGIDLHDISGGEVWVMVSNAEWMDIEDIVMVEGVGVFTITELSVARKLVRLDHKKHIGNAAPGTAVRSGVVIKNRIAKNGIINQSIILNDWVVPNFEYGMHPRTVIIGPGLVAMDLEQMLGRFVRVGQMSETLRIVAYIGNLKGEVSWEAAFMQKMHIKIANLQLLHKGAVMLDILANMAQSEDSIFKEILNDIKYGSLGQQLKKKPAGSALPRLDMDIDPEAENNAEPIINPGTVHAVVPVATAEDPVGDLIKATFRGGKAAVASPAAGGIQLPSAGSAITLQPNNPLALPVPGEPNQAVSGRIGAATRFEAIAPGTQVPLTAPPRISLIVRSSESYLLFEILDNDLKMVIANALVAAGFNPNYLQVVAEGVLIFRPGFGLSRLSQTEMNFVIEKALPLMQLGQITVADDEFRKYNFVPNVVVPKLTIVFESANSMRIDNEYPLIPYIITQLLHASELKYERLSKGVVRFTGTSARIIALYYSIRMLRLFEAPTIFQNVVVEDPSGVVKTLAPGIIPVVTVTGGEYRVVANRTFIELLGFVLATNRILYKPLTEKKVLDNFKDEGNGLFSLMVLPEYHDLMNKLMGRADEGKK